MYDLILNFVYSVVYPTGSLGFSAADVERALAHSSDLETATNFLLDNS